MLSARVEQHTCALTLAFSFTLTLRFHEQAACLSLAALALVAAFSILATAQAPRAFSVVEATIPEMQRAMSEGRTTSRELVRSVSDAYRDIRPLLHAVLAVNPKALEEAALRDRERAGGHVRGPLHGIPVALKDNIQTTKMPTTGGALAFERFVPPYEATLVANLRRRAPSSSRRPA